MRKKFEPLYFGEVNQALRNMKTVTDAGNIAPPIIGKASGWKKPRVMRAKSVDIFPEPDLIGNVASVLFDMCPDLTEAERVELRRRHPEVAASIGV